MSTPLHYQRSTSTRSVLALCLAVTLALIATSTASAATVRVNAFNCISAGGQWTVPAGSGVLITHAVFARTLGLTRAFVNGQATTITIGASVIDTTSYWSASEPLTIEPYGDVWLTRMIYPTGTTLAAGETMTFRLIQSSAHTYIDGLIFDNGAGGRPTHYGPGTDIDATCTVTGV